MADKSKEREAWEKAEADHLKLANEYEDKRQALKEKYQDRLSKAADEAREAQKAYNDSEAASALVGRDDGETVANNLGLSEAYKAAAGE
jgi:hypothetical protein